MMGKLPSGIVSATYQRHRDVMSAQRARQYSAILAFDEMCRKNFRDFHGRDPHPAMNMVAIRRDYDLPWRKSPIPKVARKALK